MTLVAVWRAGPRLHAIADTRLIRGPGNVLTEHGPKILPLTIICRQNGPQPGLDVEIARAEVGFAYSGSSLSALSSLALANTLCSNLLGPTGAPVPSLADVALTIANVSLSYMREVGQLSGPAAMFSAVIFGFCLQARTYRAFEIRPHRSASDLSVGLVEHNLTLPDQLLTIGSNTELLQERTRDDRALSRSRGDPEIPTVMDSPTRALQSIIDQGDNDSVGGTIQQAWVAGPRFRAIAKMLPIEPRPPSPRNVGLFVLGFDIIDMQTVGSYQIAPLGR